MKGKGVMFGKGDFGKGDFGKGDWGKGGWSPPGFMYGKGDWGKGDWGKGDWGKGEWFMPSKGDWGKGKDDFWTPVKGGWGKGCGKGNWGGDPEIEQYLAQHMIDAHAAEEFRQLSPDLQRIVIEVGSLADARDPTAVLMSRIKKAQQGILKLPQVKPGDWSCAACGDHNFARNPICRRCGAPNPQAFLTKHNIEARAADAFRELPPEMQLMVIDAGSLEDARDPTAVLMSRINKARSGTLTLNTKPGDWRCSSCGYMNFARNESCAKCGASQPDQKAWGGMGGMAPAVPMSMKRNFAIADMPSSFPAAKVRRTATFVSPGMVEEYIKRNNIEEHAAADFAALSPDLQSLVMDAGSLQDARSPTAVLISRMKKAKQGTLQAMEMKPGDWKCGKCGELNFQKNSECRACGAPREGNVAVPQSEAFLKEHNIEDHAIEKFRSLPQSLQTMVMDAGTLADARDPTAVLMSRIKKASFGELKVAQVRPGDWSCPKCGHHNFAKNKECRNCGTPNPEEAIPNDFAEEFLANNQIEQHAADALQELPPSLQKLVMEVGSLADARDPTAVLLSRIKKARTGQLKVVETRPGDWKCPNCGDLNFARNENCRKCNFQKPLELGN